MVWPGGESNHGVCAAAGNDWLARRRKVLAVNHVSLQQKSVRTRYLFSDVPSPLGMTSRVKVLNERASPSQQRIDR
jgi:hypothetical protein